MNMVYSFDSNIFISMRKKYPRENHGSLWEKVEELLNNQEILVSREVIEELEDVDDGLVRWLKGFKTCIIDNEKEIVSYVSELVNKLPGWVDPLSTKNKADPYVIALARWKNGTVVTQEGNGTLNPHHINLKRMVEQSSSVKIIDVCQLEGIPWLDIVGFLSQQL